MHARMRQLPARGYQQHGIFTEHTLYDKLDWGNGPWLIEPDRVDWVDPATGLQCLALRMEAMGCWNGYVAITKSSPLHEKTEEFFRDFAEVHGGVTATMHCQSIRRMRKWCEGTPELSLRAANADLMRVCCLSPQCDGKSLWWVGFDCGHCFDVSPEMNMQLKAMLPHVTTLLRQAIDNMGASGPGWRESYKALQYVIDECTGLAKQIKEKEAQWTATTQG